MQISFRATTIGTGPFHGAIIADLDGVHKTFIWTGAEAADEPTAYREAFNAMNSAIAYFAAKGWQAALGR